MSKGDLFTAIVVTEPVLFHFHSQLYFTFSFLLHSFINFMFMSYFLSLLLCCLLVRLIFFLISFFLVCPVIISIFYSFSIFSFVRYISLSLIHFLRISYSSLDGVMGGRSVRPVFTDCGKDLFSVIAVNIPLSTICGFFRFVISFFSCLIPATVCLSVCLRASILDSGQPRSNASY